MKSDGRAAICETSSTPSAVKITVSGAWGEDPKRYESESQTCNSKRSVIRKTSDRYVKVVAWTEED